MGKIYTKHSWDQHMQKRTGFLDTGIGVHFYQPNMEILIDDEIVTEDFEAIFPIILIESSFRLFGGNQTPQMNQKIPNSWRLECFPLFWESLYFAHRD